MTTCLSYAPRYLEDHYSSCFVLKIRTLRPLVLLIRTVLRLSTEHWCNVTDRGKQKYWEKNLSHCHTVHNKKPVLLPNCPQQTCATVILSTTNLSHCRTVHNKPVLLPYCPQQTCPTAILSKTNLSHCHTVRNKLVPLPYCPQQT